MSALSMSRAMRDFNVETYAIVIREVEHDDRVGMPIPTDIFIVLAKYENLIPNEFLKLLPLKRAVENKIELEQGKKPPRKAPFFSRPELEELKLQLKELTNGGFI